ncbi:hypothetical protein Taro_016853 [Colocasia esculenta]|uniref:Transmembrane protein n=1 Tax=Colocasia esculenta TaxID=4460 RepID=A0A843UXK1_COLES|nr:hypothetical protein [Colocasia esculenta]
MSRAGQSADVGLEKATASYVTFRSRRRAMSRSQPRCVFKQGRPSRASHEQSLEKLCSARGGCCGGFARQFGVLVWFLARSRREDVAWSGGDAVSWSVCAFFAKVGYWFDQPVVCSCVVASFLSDSCFASGCGLSVTRWHSCAKVLPVVECLMVALVWLWFLWWYLVVVGGVPRNGEALPDPRLDSEPFLADPFFFLGVRRRHLLPFHARGGSVSLLSFLHQLR